MILHRFSQENDMRCSNLIDFGNILQKTQFNLKLLSVLKNKLFYISFVDLKNLKYYISEFCEYCLFFMIMHKSFAFLMFYIRIC